MSEVLTKSFDGNFGHLIQDLEFCFSEVDILLQVALD